MNNYICRNSQLKDMEDKHSIIISMAEYKKFMGYEKFINDLKQNNDKLLEYTFERVFNVIESQASEYTKVFKNWPNTNLDLQCIFEDFKERLTDIKKLCSGKLVDLFIQETFIKDKEY